MLLQHAPQSALEVRWHGVAPSPASRVLLESAERLGVRAMRDDRAVEARRSKGSADLLAVFVKPRGPLRRDRPQVAMLRPREPGNLGTMFRTALAFGVEDVAVIGGIDPWSPHVVRASLGACFAMRIAQPADLAAFAASCSEPPILLHGAAETPLSHFGAARSAATPPRIVMGPEWPGFLPVELALGRPVAIPLDPRVESLNVGVALGIALHTLVPAP